VWILSFLLWASLGGPAQEPPPAPQPIPFSHKRHAEAGLRCAYCHPARDPGRAAGLPAESVCMGCHESVKRDSPAIATLAEHARAGRAVEWVRVYRLPGYVWFSHRAHGEASLDCQACHGTVSERDVLVKEKPITMRACMDCHARRGASNDCGFCHNPN